MTAIDGYLEAKSNGKFVANVADTLFVLRRPTLGELREFDEAIDDIVALEHELKAMKDPPEEDAPEPDPAAIKAKRREIETGLLAWWRLVFATLDSKGQQLPPDDDALEPWMLDATLLTELKSGWRSVPWGPGGSPSQQQQKAALDQLEKLVQKMPNAG